MDIDDESRPLNILLLYTITLSIYIPLMMERKMIMMNSCEMSCIHYYLVACTINYSLSLNRKHQGNTFPYQMFKEFSFFLFHFSTSK